MNMKTKIGSILDNARLGLLGNPQSPDLTDSISAAFWVGYFGYKKAIYYRGSILFSAAKAGEIYRREFGN